MMNDPGMMDCMMGAECGAMMWVMWLFWMLLIVLVVWGLYRLFTSRRTALLRNEASGQSETPMEMLQRRYAAGELSAEEYEERKRKLSE